MSHKITKTMVEGQFKQFCRAVPAPPNRRWILESNNPGDGRRRYTLGTAGIEGKERFYEWSSPIGGGGWTGAAEAYHALHNMWRTADYMRDELHKALTHAAHAEIDKWRAKGHKDGEDVMNAAALMYYHTSNAVLGRKD